MRLIRDIVNVRSIDPCPLKLTKLFGVFTLYWKLENVTCIMRNVAP